MSFTPLSAEPCCHNPDCCGPHAGPSCEECGEPAVGRSGDLRALCLDCAGLSECDRCATVVPSAETCDDGICEACQLLAARRALLVTLARAASIAATGPRRCIETVGVELRRAG